MRSMYTKLVLAAARIWVMNKLRKVASKATSSKAEMSRLENDTEETTVGPDFSDREGKFSVRRGHAPPRTQARGESNCSVVK